MAHTEALEILRGLIERIDIVHKSDGIEAIITGDIVQIIAQANPSNVPRMFESSVKVVAGA